MTKKLLALEIGSENLKAVIIHQSKSGYEVMQHQILSLSEKAFDPDGILYVNEVRPTLETVLSNLKAGKLPVALTINTSKKIVRTRELPLVPHKELEHIVRYEAEQFLPYGIDEFYIDYRVLGPGKLTSDGNEREKISADGVKVMIAALPKEILNQYMALLSACGCKLISVTLHTDALYSYANKHHLTEGKAVVICDIGANSVNTVLLENTDFLADISAENGVEDIASHFALKHGLDTRQSSQCLMGNLDLSLSKQDNEMDKLYRKIEKLNQFVTTEAEMSNADSDQSEASEAQEGHQTTKAAIFESRSELYADILREISRMMEFYRTRRFGAKVNAIYLCGGGAKLLGLVDFLKQRLDTDQIDLISDKNSGADYGDSALELMVAAIGGAIGR